MQDLIQWEQVHVQRKENKVMSPLLLYYIVAIAIGTNMQSQLHHRKLVTVTDGYIATITTLYTLSTLAEKGTFCAHLCSCTQHQHCFQRQGFRCKTLSKLSTVRLLSEGCQCFPQKRNKAGEEGMFCIMQYAYCSMWHYSGLRFRLSVHCTNPHATTEVKNLKS